MEVTENVCDCTLARVERALLKKEYKEVWSHAAYF